MAEKCRAAKSRTSSYYSLFEIFPRRQLIAENFSASSFFRLVEIRPQQLETPNEQGTKHVFIFFTFTYAFFFIFTSLWKNRQQRRNVSSLAKVPPGACTSVTVVTSCLPAVYLRKGYEFRRIIKSEMNYMK